MYVGGFLGPDMAKQVNDCKDDYKADILRQLLPRCDDKCQPMKQCESSCKALKSKCVPSSLQGYFPMVKKGGSLRSMLPMIGLSESAPEMKVIDAWLEKLDKCNSEYITDAKVCLSAKYTGAPCNPADVPAVSATGTATGAATSATTVIANTPPIDLPVFLRVVPFLRPTSPC